MRFGVLGPVCVGPVALTGRLRAGLLALLLVRPNTPVGAEALLDALWGDADPTALARLQTSVYKLRRTLDDPDRLTFDTGGYRLRVAPGELDADRFDELVGAAATVRDPARRAELLREADELWRGPPFQGLDLGALVAPGQRLAERRYTALEELHAAELECGRHRDTLAELSDLADRHPLRERLQVLLMAALHRCDRRSDALAVYRRTHAVVVVELGLEPGPELREAQRRVLAELDPLTGTAAPPRTSTPAQLPGAPGDFVGRRDELAELDEITARSRVVVVDGGAGVGKTALVAEWARISRDRFPDGVLHVDLQGFGPQDPVPAGMALGRFLRALGDDLASAPTDLDERAARYRTLSDGRRLLVVLDNAATPAQVRPLLPAATSCTVVVTSRDRLDGLAVGEGAHRLDVGPMTPQDARLLLTARLGAAAPDTRRCAEIADRCAHLPLALRVVAERLRSPGAPGADRIVDELADEEQRLDLLDTGDAHTSVRSVLSWSYRRLGPDAARMFRLCGFRCPHPGHLLDLHGAAALAGTADTRTVRGWMGELARCGLVDERPGPRYAMHDLLRLYAAELAQDEPGSAIGPRLVGQFLHTAVRAAGFLQRRETALLTVDLPDAPTPDLTGCGPALQWLDASRANLYCAADIASRIGLASVAVDLSTTLWPYLDLGRHLDDARRLHTLARSAVRALDDPAAEGIVLRALGLLELRSGRCDAATALLHEALERQDGDSRATTTVYLAAVHAAAGRLDAALRLGDEAPAAPALPLIALGRFLLRGARPREAVHVLRRASEGAENGPVRERALRSLADACRATGAEAEADEHVRAAETFTGYAGEPRARAALNTPTAAGDLACS